MNGLSTIELTTCWPVITTLHYSRGTSWTWRFDWWSWKIVGYVWKLTWCHVNDILESFNCIIANKNLAKNSRANALLNSKIIQYKTCKTKKLDKRPVSGNKLYLFHPFNVIWSWKHAQVKLCPCTSMLIDHSDMQSSLNKIVLKHWLAGNSDLSDTTFRPNFSLAIVIQLLLCN